MFILIPIPHGLEDCRSRGCFEIEKRRDASMTQVLEFLPSKCEELSSKKTKKKEFEKCKPFVIPLFKIFLAILNVLSI
jgi:hypothetical protein